MTEPTFSDDDGQDFAPAFDASAPDDELLNRVLPPYSIEAEQAVLGGLLISNEAFDRIGDILCADDFYRREHRVIFGVLLKLIQLGKPADAVTVNDELLRGEEDVGDLAYLISLAQNTPSAANIYGYAEIVRRHSVLRQLASVGTEIARMAYERKDRDVDLLLDEAEKKVLHIAEAQNRDRTFHDMPTVVRDIYEHVNQLFEMKDKNGVIGLSTGFRDMDEKTSGFQKGDLIILAGRPSMGKTAFAMNIAEYAGVHGRLPVAVFSMEMSAEQLVMRIISSMGQINYKALQNGQLKDEDWMNFGLVQEKLTDAPIFIDETPALTAWEVRTRARRLVSRLKRPLGLIVVDYIQLMSASGRSENRVEAVAEITRSLKSLARELQVPVLALSQLSRAVEQRNDKRPIMSDLRESGAIEQDADLIIFMYRDAYYNKNSDQPNLAEAIIGKHRNGPTGTVYLNFIGEYARFGNSAYKSEYE